eukprot:XP_017456262.1 PREDICTED: uncharacterized protein LOC102557539 [Rattus norvegicus]
MSHRGSRGPGRRGNRDCQSWNGGSRHGTRGRPTGDPRPRELTPAGPPPRAGHLNGGRCPRDRGPSCYPRRGRPFTPRQGPNNIRAREVGGLTERFPHTVPRRSRCRFGRPGTSTSHPACYYSAEHARSTAVRPALRPAQSRPPPSIAPPTARPEGEGCTWTQALMSTSERDSTTGTGLSIVFPHLLSLWCLDHVNPGQAKDLRVVQHTRLNVSVVPL